MIPEADDNQNNQSNVEILESFIESMSENRVGLECDDYKRDDSLVLLVFSLPRRLKKLTMKP